MADSDNDSGGGGETNYTIRTSSSPREQDRLLPIANVSRVMKKGLPANAKISKDAKETVQECVSEFISFITGEASDKCQREKRKTVNGDDLLWAMTTLGFEEYVEPLKVYLHKFREMEGEKMITAGSTGVSGGQGRQLLHADHHDQRDDHRDQRELLGADSISSASGVTAFGNGAAGIYGGGMTQSTTMRMMGGHQHHHHHQGHGHHRLYGSTSGPSTGHGRPRKV